MSQEKKNVKDIIVILLTVQNQQKNSENDNLKMEREILSKPP